MSGSRLLLLLSRKKTSLFNYMIGLGPTVYFPLLGPSADVVVNYGTLGTAANATLGAGAASPTLEAASAPGGGLCPAWDGSADYISAYSDALASALTNEGTLSIWMKVLAAYWSDNAVRYMAQLQGTGGGDVVRISKDASNRIAWLVNIDSGTLINRLKAGVTSTNWLHLAITWSKSGNVVIPYYNGVQEGASATFGSGSWNGLTGSSCIGAATTTPTGVHAGNLADYAIFPRALTPTEVSNIYALGRT